MPERLFSDDTPSSGSPKKVKGAFFADYTGEFPMPRVLNEPLPADEDDEEPAAPAPVATGTPAAKTSKGPAPAWLRTGRPALHELMRNRRQALWALGGGAVAIGGLGSGAAAMLGRPEDADDMVKTGQGGGNISPRDAGSFSNRDSSYTSGQGDLNDLGAAGLADSASAAAVAAMRATPALPVPLNRDPVLHLLRRCHVRADPGRRRRGQGDGHRRLARPAAQPDKIADPVADAALKTTPTVTMTTAQIRAAVKEGDNKAMYELARAVTGPADLEHPAALRGDGRLLDQPPQHHQPVRRRLGHPRAVRQQRHPQARPGQVLRHAASPRRATRR